jgi:ParB family transcriptional regulator, chromosome partitioning protein
LLVARKALGKGLDALIPATSTDKVDKKDILKIPVNLIADNPYQPRKVSGAEVEELASSIREHGIIQPIVVRPHGKGYQLVAGSRRLKAAQIAGLAEVPAVIRQANDQQMLALALVENLQRSNLNPIESALAFKQLADTFGMNQEEISKIVGKSRPAVTNTMRLLSLPRKARMMLEDDKITEGHARALLQMSSISLIEKVCDRIVAEDLTVRAVEKIARESNKIKLPQRGKKQDGISEAAGELISEKLGVKSSVLPGRKGGKIVIRYSSEAELTRLLEWFRSR